MSEIRPLPPLDPDMDASSNHYWSYHSLPSLLACKRPLTASADEDLFIAVHQICELAFHQMILDLDRVLNALARILPLEGSGGETSQVSEAVYFLNRVNALWATVNSTMATLAALRAFAEFRTSIGPASGFQSAQFRRIEIMSGVKQRYWEGGTADAMGKKHVAETTFDEVYGATVAGWFDHYLTHSLKLYARRLASRPDVFDTDFGTELVRAFLDYDDAQLVFHKAHLGVAVTQLKKVGVEIGTGGTSFKSYLAKYEKEHAPLFAELAALKERVS
jgi:tryptophan 2,3-dioxygenase